MYGPGSVPEAAYRATLSLRTVQKLRRKKSRLKKGTRLSFRLFTHEIAPVISRDTPEAFLCYGMGVISVILCELLHQGIRQQIQFLLRILAGIYQAHRIACHS